MREAVAHDALVSELIDAMLNARAALWKEYCRLHDLVVRLVAGHELCRRFMQIPGVGPIAALSFMTAVDDPSRFRRSRDVAAYFGLTSRRWQSGSSIDVKGRISKAGDGDVRRALYEAASALLTRYKKKDKVKAWGLALAKRSSHRKATVAVARKLAVIMHAMWTSGTLYCGDSARTPRRRRCMPKQQLSSANCSGPTHEARDPATWQRRGDGRDLNTELRRRRMRTGAAPTRRNARYLACDDASSDADRSRRIACDVAPSHRWKDAPRRRPRCLAAATLCRR
ncbi:hypothetical protein ACVWZV_009833 [Bradyrhizobium sp. GM5.1]